MADRGGEEGFEPAVDQKVHNDLEAPARVGGGARSSASGRQSGGDADDCLSSGAGARGTTVGALASSTKRAMRSGEAGQVARLLTVCWGRWGSGARAGGVLRGAVDEGLRAVVGVVEERERARARRLGAAGRSDGDAGGDGRRNGGRQQYEPLHAISFDLVDGSGKSGGCAVPLSRRRRTTAAPTRARNTSARPRNANQPIAASVPFLSGTPLAVNTSAASAATIAIERWIPSLVICLSSLGIAGLSCRVRGAGRGAHAAGVTTSLRALVARGWSVSLASARRSSETLMTVIQTNVNMNVGGSADVKTGMLASRATAMATAK